MEIKFQDPPPTFAGRNAASQHFEFAEALRANPGRWAVLADDASASVVTSVKAGRYAAFRPAGSFEATSRGIGKANRAKVYVRYVGPRDELDELAATAERMGLSGGAVQATENALRAIANKSARS